MCVVEKRKCDAYSFLFSRPRQNCREALFYGPLWRITESTVLDIVLQINRKFNLQWTRLFSSVQSLQLTPGIYSSDRRDKGQYSLDRRMIDSPTEANSQSSTFRRNSMSSYISARLPMNNKRMTSSRARLLWLLIHYTCYVANTDLRER